jgi:hypothetical protein
MMPPLPELFVAVKLPARDAIALRDWAKGYGEACAAAERERIAKLMERQHTWLTNVAAANLIRKS